ncbi:MAG TPA: NAD-dependent epimerase/dehydratase family protein, partial [Gemmataceae bacterium]|nr:NAD-dependent epimerase/dehydratase family protein [Gemmataceae bacterium]
MKVVIPGGTGQVGSVLGRALAADGHEVVVLSRHPAKAPWRVVAWDAETLGPWAEELDGADVVVNLAGRNVNCRYTAANRRTILESRVRSTRVVGEAIARASRPPRVWLQASTATIYAHRYDAANDEA